MKTEADIGVVLLDTKECWTTPGAWKSQELFCPRALAGSMALATFCFQTAVLQNSEKINLCCLKPPRRW